MASLATHFSAFLFLFPLGTRRLLCSFSLYLKNPSLYLSKSWYFSDPKWKNLDLYILLVVLPIASFSHLFLFLTFTGHPSYRFAFLHQSAVVFMFWVLLVIIIFREFFGLFAIPENFVFILAGVSFFVEYSMNGRGITGIGGVAYQLLGTLTVVCASCCLFLSIKPFAFFAEFFLSSALMLKGTWVLQVGLSLYTDSFALNGCTKISKIPNKGDIDIKCELEQDKFRGVALINLLFIAHVTLVLITSLFLFGLLHRNSNMRCGEASGSLLAGLGSETMLTRSDSELEIE